VSLPITTADQRLAEPRGIKGCIFGKSGIGKTSLLWTLDPARTLFIDLEAGDLAIEAGRATASGRGPGRSAGISPSSSAGRTRPYAMSSPTALRTTTRSVAPRDLVRAAPNRTFNGRGACGGEETAAR